MGAEGKEIVIAATEEVAEPLKTQEKSAKIEILGENQNATKEERPEPKKLPRKIKIALTQKAKEIAIKFQVAVNKAGAWLRARRKGVLSCLVLLFFILAFFGGIALRNEMIYSKGVALYENQEYQAAVEQFQNVSNYKDSNRYIDLCQKHMIYNQALALMNNRDYKSARELFDSIYGFMDATSQGARCSKFLRYEEALAHLENGEYELARKLFVYLDDFEDAAAMAETCVALQKKELYDMAEALFQTGKFLEAYDLFTALKDYENSAQRAVECTQNFYAQKRIRLLDLDAQEYKRYFEYVGSLFATVPMEYINGYYEFAISGGRKILTDDESGDLYLVDNSGQEELLLKGYRKIAGEYSIEDQGVRFGCMLDDNRFLYYIVGWEWQAAIGVYDIANRKDYRFEPASYGEYVGYYAKKQIGDKIIFERTDIMQTLGILILDLSSYTYTEIVTENDIEQICKAEGDLYLSCDVSPDGTKAAFLVKTEGVYNVIIYSLTEKTILQKTALFTIKGIDDPVEIVYHIDEQIFIFTNNWQQENSNRYLYVMGLEQ